MSWTPVLADGIVFAGLLDDAPRMKESIYSMMRLRALRTEIDIRLALATFTLQQAADYLATTVPMDRNTAARQESGNFIGWWNVRVPREREAEARELLRSIEEAK